MFYGSGAWLDNGSISFTVKNFNKNKVENSFQRLACKYVDQGNTLHLVLDEKGHKLIDGINRLVCEKSDSALSEYQKSRAMPDILLQGKMDEKDSFIKGLFDSDSGFRVEKLVLCNDNKNFMEDVQVILLEFGRYTKLERLNQMEKYMLITIDSSHILVDFLKEQDENMDMAESNAVPVKITTIVTTAANQPVYDIREVDGGVFYANGILERNPNYR